MLAPADATPEALFDKAFAELREALSALPGLRAETASLSATAIAVLRAGGKLLVCGNGGSAAEAQHLATEMTIRYARERRGLPAIALTADSTAVTAAGNDFGFDAVFARQVEALGRPGDLLIAYTTSGKSPNVLAALDTARREGLATACITGHAGGEVAQRGLADHLVIAPGVNTARIQEMHLFVTHAICEAVDVAFAGQA